mmetsp:Transcript_39373/g.94641  ORF Transcript_39373/g.94641 Transcript_39373/m.94641 type:complete len:399 (+) Transcript_39373:48-1244(+)
MFNGLWSLATSGLQDLCCASQRGHRDRSGPLFPEAQGVGEWTLHPDVYRCSSQTVSVGSSRAVRPRVSFVGDVPELSEKEKTVDTDSTSDEDGADSWFSASTPAFAWLSTAWGSAAFVESESSASEDEQQGSLTARSDTIADRPRGAPRRAASAAESLCSDHDDEEALHTESYPSPSDVRSKLRSKTWMEGERKNRWDIVRSNLGKALPPAGLRRCKTEGANVDVHRDPTKRAVPTVEDGAAAHSNGLRAEAPSKKRLSTETIQLLTPAARAIRGELGKMPTTKVGIRGFFRSFQTRFFAVIVREGNFSLAWWLQESDFRIPIQPHGWLELSYIVALRRGDDPLQIVVVHRAEAGHKGKESGGFAELRLRAATEARRAKWVAQMGRLCEQVHEAMEDT